MSRIGKIPIDIPSGVNVIVDGNKVSVKGKLGELSQELGDSVDLAVEENKLVLTRKSDSKTSRSQHGLYRSLLNNMVKGVSEGFEKSLDIIGVGYRASKKGNDLEILIGYSNPVSIKAIDGITFDLPNQNLIVVKGIDKQKVGEVANMIRNVRKPEPYKGKGIKYKDEIIKRKVGKTTASGGKTGGKK
ncbi:50S ribosomal protein L6 [bacterium]|nr:50S ribosomal protein L6 [bacterium]